MIQMIRGRKLWLLICMTVIHFDMYSWHFRISSRVDMMQVTRMCVNLMWVTGVCDRPDWSCESLSNQMSLWDGHSCTTFIHFFPTRCQIFPRCFYWVSPQNNPHPLGYANIWMHVQYQTESYMPKFAPLPLALVPFLVYESWFGQNSVRKKLPSIQ